MSEPEFALNSQGPMWNEDPLTLPRHNEDRDIENRFRKMSKGLKLF